jgi:hypothetical protein
MGWLWLGGGFEGDLVSEGFEFVDELACTCLGTVDAAGEVVRAEVAVGGGLGEHMPDDHDQGVGGGGFLAALCTEAAVEAAELGTDVGAGAARGPGALGENRADPTGPLAVYLWTICQSQCLQNS